jgi:hypothetical protein
VFPNVEVRHRYAVDILAEKLNSLQSVFLFISLTQLAFSKPAFLPEALAWKVCDEPGLAARLAARRR